MEAHVVNTPLGPWPRARAMEAHAPRADLREEISQPRDGLAEVIDFVACLDPQHLDLRELHGELALHQRACEPPELLLRWSSTLVTKSIIGPLANLARAVIAVSFGKSFRANSHGVEA